MTFQIGNKIGPRFKKGNKVNLGRKQTEEHKRKVREQISGENHYLWKTDRTQIVQYWTGRNNPEYI